MILFLMSINIILMIIIALFMVHHIFIMHKQTKPIIKPESIFKNCTYCYWSKKRCVFKFGEQMCVLSQEHKE
jgi:hypothetical protein